MSRHSTHHDYLNRYWSPILERLYDVWGSGEHEVESCYVGQRRHADLTGEVIA